jgi:RecQ family ATP-dependent DNA helicase
MASRTDQFEAAKKEIKHAFKKAEEEEKCQIKETDEAKEPSPWLKRVGCISHLASVDRKDAQEYVEPVDEKEEPHLAILCTAFDWLIQDGQYHAVREVVGLQTLFEANKKEVDKETNMPFDSWMDITTVERYVEVWRQLLLFVFRAEEDDPEFRPPYMLTKAQQTAMQTVRDKIQAFQQWKQEQENSAEDEVEDRGEDEGFGEDNGGRGDDRRADEEVDEGFKDGVSDEEVEWMDQIQREVLRFCIALLDHPLQDHEYESAIISGLAVLMIKGEKGWHDAEDFTPKYSAVIKLARLMVIQEAYQQRQEQIHEYQGADLTEREARTMATSYYRLVKQSVDQYMTMAHGGRDSTPMQWIYQTRSYGFKIRYTTPAAGKIQWIREEVLYPGTRVQMSQLRSMVHGLVGEARDELFGKLMMVDAKGGDDPKHIPPIDWENTVDQPSETKVGWSFLDDERNKFGAHKEWWLFERMYQEQALREQFLDVDGKLKDGAGEAYQRHIERFLEVLLVLMHLCGGQPSRAPEILGLRWKNTTNGGVRNIIIEDRMVAFVAQYHKGYRSSGNIKIIHRYLPREVGELLVYYLWLVLPFWEKLQCQMTGQVVSSAFIWGDGEKKEHRQWTGPKRKRGDEPEARSEARSEGIGEAGRERDARHVRKKRSRADKREQRTWSSWTSERVRKIMQEASVRWMGSQSTLSISAWRQIAIAISRRFCREDRFEDDQGKLDADDGWDEDNTAGDDPWDLQAGHGTHIAGMIYARELMEGNNTIIGRREQFRRVSQRWHRFLEFVSACQPTPDPVPSGTKRKRSSVEDEMDEVQAVRWKKLRTIDIQQALEDMYGAGAQFRGLQKPALEAIMKNESPVLVVMGTSVGKTMLFQIPAKSVSSGTTVVITPLISLQDHMVERCQQVGISCTKWESQHASEMRAQIVIVTPEAAVSKAFGTFLNDLQGRRELVRIVYDECHTVMDSTPDFRPKMRQLGELATREVQMVFLTATLPPRIEAEFMRIMKIQPEDVHVFRAPTTRPNIAYSVFEHDPDVDETEAVCQLVREKLEQYPGPSKIIVYGGTIKRTKELSRALGCHEYYREVGNRDEKEKIMGRWQRGDGRLIVATNAFGLGIDAPDVRVVIHVGAIYQMRNYSQESGRGGRDGQRSEAIVVMPAGQQEAFQKKQAQAQARTQPWKMQSRVMSVAEAKKVEWDKMERFLSGSKCRRIFLDAEMDGREDRVRCEEGEERCDVCEEDDAMMAESEAQRVAYVQEEQERQERERQDRWMDSGIDVPSSNVPTQSIGIPEPSSSPVPTSRVDQGNGRDGTWPSVMRSHSPSSVASFDHGFAADAIPAHERDVFTAQQAQRRQQRWRTVVEEQDEGHEVWDLENRLDSWVGKCPLCYVRQCQGWEVNSQHRFDQCRDELYQTVAGEAQKLQRIHFERFASCTFCKVAQKICSRWAETHEGSRRFKEVPGGVCQYSGIIQPAVAAMMAAAPFEVVQVSVYDAMQAEGIWGQGSQLRGDEEAEVCRVMMIWFSKKIIWGSMEGSVLLRVFYRLTVRLEEWGRCQSIE